MGFVLKKHSLYGHVFTIDGQAYYYDVHQNEIVEADEEFAAVLSLYGSKTRAEIETILGRLYQIPKINEACDIIEQAQLDEALFLAQRPVLVPPDPKLSQPGVCDANLQHLVLSVTNQCNLRCKYCLHGAGFDWVRGHSGSSMSSETALKALEYFLARADEGCPPFVSFYGGEALLELDLIETVVTTARAHPRGKDVIFVVDTNGVLLDSRAIDLVVREKMFLQISLDGPRGVHDRNRVTVNGGESFQNIIGNIDKLLEKEPTVVERLSFVATMAPPIDLPKLAEFFADFPPYTKHGIKTQPNVRVNTANLRGQDWPVDKQESESLNTQINVAREQYLRAVGACRRAELSPVIRSLFEPGLIRMYHRSRAALGDTFTPGGNCAPGQRKLHVTASGRFQPCERTGSRMAIGDVETGLKAAEIHLLKESFYKEVQDRCGNCWALRMCGICFAVQAEHADVVTGEFPIPESACDAIRRDKEETLKMMARILKMPEECREFLKDTVVR